MFPSCGFLWSFPASTVCLFLCQPLSLAVVVNRADDCQLRGLCGEPVACEWQGEETLESEVKGDPSLSKAALGNSPTCPEGFAPDHPNGTLQTEASRDTLSPSPPGAPLLLVLLLPQPPGFRPGRWQRGHSGLPAA